MNELKNDYNTSVPISNELPNNPSVTRSSRRLFLCTATVIIFLFGISVGFVLNNSPKFATNHYIRTIQASFHAPVTNSSFEHQANLDLFWKVWDEIHTQYVDQPVDDSTLIYSAISGMVAGVGDQYSVFFNPEQSKAFLSEVYGSFEGIGAEIGIKDDHLTIIAPLPGSPASQAGLLAGDTVLAINGTNASSFSLNDAVETIRGEKGTTVTLTIQRVDTPEPFDVIVTRDTIHVESVKWEMVNEGDHRIAHITITNFAEDTATKFQEAINNMLIQQPDALILDLRNNPGGFLDGAVNIASKFIPEGQAVVYEQFGNGATQAYKASGLSPLQNLPTIILQNEGSASASEILAGALEDYGKAKIIGVTSFGKGTVQDLETFDDDSSLKLTIARWLTPTQHLINNIGIYPDYWVERTADDVAAERDPQLDAALLYIKDQAAFTAQYQPYVPPAQEELTKQK
ncbi:MAG: S41 family peptidase [Candidatus Kerfeldbacteria bacterium]|nr:S41 family peptidase [Candidatus Kerfeldbacteria bacterium]